MESRIGWELGDDNNWLVWNSEAIIGGEGTVSPVIGGTSGCMKTKMLGWVAKIATTGK